MAETEKPLLIKRYASRRLYNTETSDYVTLEDIAGFIRQGRDVKIVDLKSGDDLTRQYLLQIVAEHESKGESVLPIAVLTDLVRSYTTQAQSVVPQFLAMSFEMLRESQSKMMENFTTLPSAMNPMSGIEAMQRQQKMFLASMVPGWKAPEDGETPAEGEQAALPAPGAPTNGSGQAPEAPLDSSERAELETIKQQLADLQEKMARLKE